MKLGTKQRPTGLKGDDLIIDGTGSGYLYGNAGDDVLIGDKGNDVLFGGPGNNTLHGGPGNDTFVIANTAQTQNEIVDLRHEPGNDDLMVFVGFGADLRFNGQCFETRTEPATPILCVLRDDRDGRNDIVVVTAGTEDVLLRLRDTVAADLRLDRFLFIHDDDFAAHVHPMARNRGTDGHDVYTNGVARLSPQGFRGTSIGRADEHELVLAETGLYYIVTLPEQVIRLEFDPNTATEQGRFYDGQGGNDLIVDGIGGNTLRGGSGNDVIASDGGDDVVFGDDGNDIINAGAGKDIIYGGAGDDVVTGGPGEDTIYLGAGKDTSSGGPGKDTFVLTQEMSSVLAETVDSNASFWSTYTPMNILADFDVNEDRLDTSAMKDFRSDTHIPAISANGFIYVTIRSNGRIYPVAIPQQTVVFGAIKNSWVLYVDEAPIAVNDTITLLEDQTIPIHEIQLLANDSDKEDAELNFVGILEHPTRGTLIENGDRSYDYIPNENENGSDQFVYRVSDSAGNESTATVFLTITPVNDAPQWLRELQDERLGRGPDVDIAERNRPRWRSPNHYRRIGKRSLV